MKDPARAVFLDRDGVINAPEVRDGKPYPPKRPEDFRVLPGVSEACHLLRNAGFLLVVATNQPDVGRGQQDLSVVQSIHQLMCQLLPIDRVEVCYDAGDHASNFRKPGPGMLLRAAGELNIDLAKSYMVGDRWRDVDCGCAAGCTTIFIDRGYKER
jgi:D-glycero-D-manno-heptose 1,7-bisphosphate phosphatase